MTVTPDWIAVDWGTSHLRVFAMSNNGGLLASDHSTNGMGSLSPTGFESAVLELISPWLESGKTIPVIACGMVGARQGWVEAPYRSVPCTPIGAGLTKAPVTDPRIDVSIISGLSQIKPPDVMRGEETQIAGFLNQNSDFYGVLCLPGTHTKWVQISAGEVVSFVTFMTGELFALLSENSVLRHTVGSDGWDDAAFAEALSDAISKPQYFATRLFSLRATQLLTDLPPATARARLSGTLIGIELAAARPYWLGQEIAIIGDAALSNIYAQALTAQGATATPTDAQHMTLSGLTAAYTMMDP